MLKNRITNRYPPLDVEGVISQWCVRSAPRSGSVADVIPPPTSAAHDAVLSCGLPRSGHIQHGRSPCRRTDVQLRVHRRVWPRRRRRALRGDPAGVEAGRRAAGRRGRRRRPGSHAGGRPIPTWRAATRDGEEELQRRRGVGVETALAHRHTQACAESIRLFMWKHIIIVLCTGVGMEIVKLSPAAQLANGRSRPASRLAIGYSQRRLQRDNYRLTL